MRELDVSPLLNACFAATETVCVRDCCGIDALDPNLEDIRQWAREVGEESLARAIHEVRQLICDCEDRRDVVSVRALNACTPTDDSRAALIGVLKKYESAMADANLQ